MSGPRIVDVTLSVFFLVVAIAAIWGVREFPFQDQLYPYVASAVILLSVIVYGGRQIIIGPMEIQSDEGGNKSSNPFTRAQLPTVLPLAGAIFGLVLGVYVLGHLIAVPTFAFIYMLWRREKIWIAAIGAALLVAFIWGLLINVMEVAMPHPLLFQWLDIDA
jgi:hypothetical protein